MSKARLLAKESVRIQKGLTTKHDVSILSKAALRLANSRSPISGVTDFMPNYDETDSKLQEIETREVLRHSHRLNPRILEAWINNTVSDAEQIELPEELVSADTRQPLNRFGVDRQSLISAGVPSHEVDRVFRALFVYSIGFYQLINQAMEHCTNKNMLIAGIWKVYSMLLEYCCNKDYRMVVKTLMQECEQEVTRVESEFKQQFELLKQNEQNLLTNLEDMRRQQHQAQVQLVQETILREELQEELAQRGSGHEYEVELRLKFESKLNQMFAKQRDLEVRLNQQQVMIKAAQAHLDEKQKAIEATNLKYSTLLANKQDLDIHVGKLERSLAQQTLQLRTAELKMIDVEKRIDLMHAQLAKARENQQNTLAEAVESNLVIERLQSENKTALSAIRRLENELLELKQSRQIVDVKFCEVEENLAAQVEESHSLKAQLVVSQAATQAKTRELELMREKLDEMTELSTADREHNIHLSQELDTKLFVVEELQKQLDRLLEGVSEATKGRKVAEERAKVFERRKNEVESNLDAVEKAYITARRDAARLEILVKDLELTRETLTLALDSTEKQNESLRQTLIERSETMTQAHATEKLTQDMWIEKYEQEQEAHNASILELKSLKHTAKDLELLTSDYSVKLHQVNLELEAAQLWSKQLLDSNYALEGERNQFRRELEAHIELNSQNQASFARKLAESEEHFSGKVKEAELNILGVRMMLNDAESLQMQLWHKLLSQEDKVIELNSALARLTFDKAKLTTDLEKAVAMDGRGRMRIEEMLVQVGDLQTELTQTTSQLRATEQALEHSLAELQLHKSVRVT